VTVRVDARPARRAHTASAAALIGSRVAPGADLRREAYARVHARGATGGIVWAASGDVAPAVTMLIVGVPARSPCHATPLLRRSAARPARGLLIKAPLRRRMRGVSRSRSQDGDADDGRVRVVDVCGGRHHAGRPAGRAARSRRPRPPAGAASRPRGGDAWPSPRAGILREAGLHTAGSTAAGLALETRASWPPAGVGARDDAAGSGRGLRSLRRPGVSEGLLSIRTRSGRRSGGDRRTQSRRSGDVRSER